jgi:hypothetical protein
VPAARLDGQRLTPRLRIFHAGLNWAGRDR